MTTKQKTSSPERVILLLAGESGAGKSFFVANLKNALIFDTDIGGGLSYADARIAKNGSERIEVGSYLEVIEEIKKRGRTLAGITTLVIDHLTALNQEAVIRHNPSGIDDFGKSYERARREWLKIRTLVKLGDYNLVCTAHMKSKYEAVGAGKKKEATGMTSDAAKNIETDFHTVLYLERQAGTYPSTAKPVKWRRDPDDPKGPLPLSFPLTMEQFLRINGASMEGERHETPLATAEQVERFTQLVNTLKLPEGHVEKWFTKAKVEEAAEMTAETIAKCIEYMEGLVKAEPPKPAARPAKPAEPPRPMPQPEPNNKGDKQRVASADARATYILRFRNCGTMAELDHIKAELTPHVTLRLFTHQDLEAVRMAFRDRVKEIGTPTNGEKHVATM